MFTCIPYLTNKVYAYALVRKKTGLHANFRFIGAMVSEFHFFKKKKKKKNMDNLHIYLYSGPNMTFSSTFLHAVAFLHVLHLDVLKRQIEIDLPVFWT